MRGVAKIKEQIEPLEEEVIDLMMEREDPKKADETLRKIAELKTEATRIHLHCIIKTLEVLTPKQVALLLPFWQS